VRAHTILTRKQAATEAGIGKKLSSHAVGLLFCAALEAIKEVIGHSKSEIPYPCITQCKKVKMGRGNYLATYCN